MLINKRIGAIEVDTAFADHEQAYELLELVCNDVKEVMDEYDLQVSQIIEMTDDTLDLGYNENETLGWIKIRVRRTRNNQAFQSESMVMDTLLHELAHNRYLGHGEDFNEFFSELKLSLEGRTNRYSIRYEYYYQPGQGPPAPECCIPIWPFAINDAMGRASGDPGAVESRCLIPWWNSSAASSTNSVPVSPTSDSGFDCEEEKDTTPLAHSPNDDDDDYSSTDDDSDDESNASSQVDHGAPDSCFDIHTLGDTVNEYSEKVSKVCSTLKRHVVGCISRLESTGHVSDEMESDEMESHGKGH